MIKQVCRFFLIVRPNVRWPLRMQPSGELQQERRRDRQTDRQMDERQTVTLRFPLDTASVVNIFMWTFFFWFRALTWRRKHHTMSNRAGLMKNLLSWVRLMSRGRIDYAAYLKSDSALWTPSPSTTSRLTACTCVRHGTMRRWTGNDHRLTDQWWTACHWWTDGHWPCNCQLSVDRRCADVQAVVNCCTSTDRPANKIWICYMPLHWIHVDRHISIL